MKGILITKVKWLIRNPGTFLIMTAMSIIFALILGGSTINKMNVPAYKSDKLDDTIVHLLEENEFIVFKWLSEEELEEIISSGKREFGLKLSEDDFQLLVGIESPNVEIVERTVQQAYIKSEQLALFTEEHIGKEKEALYHQLTENPIFTLETNSFQGEDAFIYDGHLQPLFGFTLFFVITTISYSVFQILVEKRDGIWDRMILSPVRKWEMYMANFVYSFSIGYIQVLIVFLLFRYIVQIDFNGKFLASLLVMIPYVFAIVSLAVFITGIVKTVQQFNAVIPIVSVSMAMIGGAFWPLEIVESTFMLTLSKFNPLTYGMELLSGVTTYQYTFEELLYPISILLLMGVLLTGLGIHLMEKRFIH